MGARGDEWEGRWQRKVAQLEALSMGTSNGMPRSLVTLEVTAHVLTIIDETGVSLLDQRPCVHGAEFEPGLLAPEGSQRVKVSSL